MPRREILEVILEAHDRTGPGIKGTIGSLGKLGMVAGATVVAGFAAATIAIGAFSIKAIQAGGDAEEMMAKLGETFGIQTQSIITNLDAFGDEVGRSRYELRGMAADTGAVLKGMGLQSDLAADLSEDLVKLAVDVGSFNNVSAPDVIDRFTRALTGEFESLKALGIVINQNRIDQAMANEGITESWQELDQASRANIIYRLLLENTSDAQGDAARTSGSWTNQMVGLRGKLKDITTEIGLKLLPVLTPLLTTIGDLAEEYLPKLAGVFEEKVIPVFQGAADVLTAILDAGFGSVEMWEALSGVLGEQITGKLQTITETISTLVTEQLIPFVQTHGPELKAAFIAIGTVLGIAALISGIAAALGLIVSPVTLIVAVVGILAAAWAGNWLGIQDKLKAVWAFIQPVLQRLQEWLQVNIPVAIEALRAVWVEKLEPIFRTLWAFLKEHVIPLLLSLAELYQVTLGLAVTALAGLFQNILLPAIKDVFAWISEKLSPTFETLGEKLEPIGALLDSVTEAVGKLITKLKNLKLPDWLTPGSPTPLEIGLRGITEAMSALNAGPMPGLAGGMAAGGGVAGSPLRVFSVQLQVHYQPLLSTADEVELETRLVPLIREQLRDLPYG